MILDEILENKRDEVEARKQQAPIQALRDALEHIEPARGFANALRQPSQGLIRKAAATNQPAPDAVIPRLIAEIKEKSPSKGIIRTHVNPAEIAQAYQAGGAACISVLTDDKYFGGKMERINEVKATVTLPVLQKDFIIDPYQVVEARAAGADCILLIVAGLRHETLEALHWEAHQLGMDALVETHTLDELEYAIDKGFPLIGINNRDLKTFEISLTVTEELAEKVPEDRVLVGESGIHNREDAMRLAKVGVDAVLVGEALMSSGDIVAKVRELTR